MLYDLLTKNIDWNDFFEKWFKDYESSDNFEDRMWHNHESEKEEYINDNPELSEKDVKEWFEARLKKHAQEWFDEHLDDWWDELDNKGKVDGENIIIYRSMTVNNIEDFVSKLKKNEFQGKFKGIGEYWAWDENKADSHWGNFDSGYESIIIKGKISIKKIELETTILKNFCHSIGMDEAEIQIEQGQKVFIQSIISSDKTYDINQEVDV